MPLSERRMRWEAMMQKLRNHTIQQWFADFVDALQATRIDAGTAVAEVLDPPTTRPLRAVNAGARYH
jgi:trehalose 6-phosphate synthase